MGPTQSSALQRPSLTWSSGPKTSNRCRSGRTGHRAPCEGPGAPGATPDRETCTRPGRPGRRAVLGQGRGGSGEAEDKLLKCAGRSEHPRPTPPPPGPGIPPAPAPQPLGPQSRPLPGVPGAHDQQPPLPVVDIDHLSPSGQEDLRPVAQHARLARRHAPERAAEARQVFDPRPGVGHRGIALEPGQRRGLGLAAREPGGGALRFTAAQVVARPPPYGGAGGRGSCAPSLGGVSAGAGPSCRWDKASAHRAVCQRANVFKAKRGKHEGLASPLLSTRGLHWTRPKSKGRAGSPRAATPQSMSPPSGQSAPTATV